MEIAAKLEKFFGISGLQIQVVWQDDDLVVVFNRPAADHLEYNQMTKQTVKLLQDLKVPAPQRLIFYSRILGQEEPDWDKIVKVKKAGVSKPTAAEEELTVLQAEEKPVPTQVVSPNKPKRKEKPTPTPIKEEIKESEPIVVSPPQLSDFCFTRNKALVKAELPAPAQKVAEHIKFFHELSERVKLELAPVLEDFFKNPDKTSLVSVPKELRSWFEELKKLKDDEFRSQAIWLSRYCYNPEKTMEEVNALFEKLVEQEQEKHKTLEPSPESIAPTATISKRSGSAATTSSRSSRQVVSKRAQRFTPDELVFMAGGSLLIGAIGWFLWGTAAALTPFGWIAAIAGIASGVGSILGNQGIRTAAALVLLVLYLIFFGFGFIILWIEFLGWLTGLIVAGAVTSMKESSGAESITAPKPFRLLVVYGIVILIGMGYAAATWFPRMQVTVGEGDPKGSNPVDIVEVTVTDETINMSKTQLKTSFAMRVSNQASKDCDIDISPQSGGVSYSISPSPLVKSRKTETLNVELSNGGIFRLGCQGWLSEPNLLSLDGPIFTAKDD